MASIVLLQVTPKVPPDEATLTDVELPEDVSHLLATLGVQPGHGWSRRGSDPWRMQWQISGPDRVEVGKRLETDLRALGYEANAYFLR